MKFPFILLFLICLSSAFGNEQLEDITLDGITYDDETVSKLITVIISTSPIKSHPDTKHIYEAQKSLFQIPALAKCKKIITFDGIRRKCMVYTERYNLYKDCMLQLTQTDPYFANTQLVFCPRWGHLSGTIKEAMKYVDTPFVFIHQHDLVILKEFDLNKVIATMIANPNVKYVHFWKGINGDGDPWNGPVDEVVDGEHFVPLCRSFGWTDQTHVASADYYRSFILPKCNKVCMEWVIMKKIKKDIAEKGMDEGHRPYGTYLYGTLEDGHYIYHSDGANN